MKIISYRHLIDFEWWGPAVENIHSLTIDEVEILNDILSDLFPEGIYEIELNDILAYDFDWVLELLGKPVEE